jgi:hypothetical protein
MAKSEAGRLAFLMLAALLLFVHGAYAAEVYLALNATGQGTYEVDGRFWTPGDLTGTWKVLTDYDHLPSFIPSLVESQITHRTADSLTLRQEAIGRILGVFHRDLHVLLRVQEQPGQEIRFEDSSHQDFKSYSGFWRIGSAAGGGTWVDYHLVAEPNFFAPAVVARRSFRSNAKNLLLSVQSEIIRRNDLSSTLLCCSQIKN